jgi:uncharacterized membrane protein YcaP (DUF421 family)
MMDAMEDLLRTLLGVGLEEGELGLLQTSLRAVVVYAATVAMVRLGKKRFMGGATAFDVILGIMLGSIVSRAITGNAPLGPALAAAAVLVLLHSLFSWVAVNWHGFGTLIKGHARVLIRDGAIDRTRLRQSHMTERDLWEDLRAEGISRLDEVAEARLERSGKLSVIKANRGKAECEPRIVDIRVSDGVQIVRVEIG